MIFSKLVSLNNVSLSASVYAPFAIWWLCFFIKVLYRFPYYKMCRMDSNNCCLLRWWDWCQVMNDPSFIQIIVPVSNWAASHTCSRSDHGLGLTRVRNQYEWGLRCWGGMTIIDALRMGVGSWGDETNIRFQVMNVPSFIQIIVPVVKLSCLAYLLQVKPLADSC